MTMIQTTKSRPLSEGKQVICGKYIDLVLKQLWSAKIYYKDIAVY